MPRAKFATIPEESIQKTVMAWVNLHPSIKPYVIHIPNEGKRTARYGKLLKDLGMRPGVSDLFIAMARHGFNGAWIELKSAQGRLSASQQAFLEDMSQQNYFTRVCWSIEDAINTISWYALQKGTSSSTESLLLTA